MKENQKILLQLRYDKGQLFIITCVDVEFVDALRKPCNNNAFLMKTITTRVTAINLSALAC